jgi:hypothetical protein
MKIAGRGRLQFSVRSILVATGIVAILLVPTAWVARERQEMRRLSDLVLQAREEAIRAVILAERQRTVMRDSDVVPDRGASDQTAGPARNPWAPLEIRIERLERENSALKEAVEIQRQQIERLKAVEAR